MARPKRKVNRLIPQEEQQVDTTAKKYRTAGYVRLSVEDSGRPGSETLDGQKQFLRSYIESQPDLDFIGLWCDNGQTGTDFQRPQFEALMEKVKHGEINCICVKDLSRFGRNYKETGNYLEPDYAYIHRELAKRSVTLTLLWNEYVQKAESLGRKPYIF